MIDNLGGLVGNVRLTHMLLLAGFFTLLCGGTVFLLALQVRDYALEARIRSVLRRDASPRRFRPVDLGSLLLRQLRVVGDRLRTTAFLSRKDVEELERSLAATGLDPAATASAVIGAKLLLFVLIPVAAFAYAVMHGWALQNQLIATGLAVPVGLLLPNWGLRLLRKSYRKALARGLPDALDLMVVCAEAGLGLETTIERVAVEIRGVSPQVAFEFAALCQEMQVSADRRQAFTHFGQSSGVDGLRRVSATLLQTMQYGTPLAAGLRTLSRDMRQERLTQFEARAARLPALLVLPLILFILPCLFIVLIGPSIIQLLANFGN